MQTEELDGLAVLEQEARRMRLEKECLARFAQERTRLLLLKPAKKGANPAATMFFATLALRLQPGVIWGKDSTACTDGKLLSMNPEWVEQLSSDQFLGVIVHEVIHCALGHQSRRGRRDPKTYNVAADLVVNPLVLGAGIQLPPGRIMPGEGQFKDMPPNMSVEEYYLLLQKDGEDEPGEEEDGEDQGDGELGVGDVESPAGGSAAESKSQQDWQKAVSQAEQACKGRGEMPAGLARLVQEQLVPKVDWREQLREFVSRLARNDYAWSPPNRRHVWRGLYLPGLWSEELGDVVIAVDTSGSIGQRELALFAGEIQGILEPFQGHATIVYHDHQVAGVQEWGPSDGPLILEPKGGGGTSHKPVFEWIGRERPDAAAVVCLTDCESEFPPEQPWPTLWAKVGRCNTVPPWGRIIHVEEQG